jgi:nitrogen fixation-related uncharacterized protein
MNALEIFALGAIMLGAGISLGFLWGLRNGERIGRDREWMDSFFRNIKRDAERRDKAGRFKKR